MPSLKDRLTLAFRYFLRLKQFFLKIGSVAFWPLSVFITQRVMRSEEGNKSEWVRKGKLQVEQIQLRGRKRRNWRMEGCSMTVSFQREKKKKKKVSLGFAGQPKARDLFTYGFNVPLMRSTYLFSLKRKSPIRFNFVR